MVLQQEAFRINEPDVIHQLFDQEVVAVDLRNGTYYSLSSVGGRAWLAFGTSGATVEDVARQLAGSYAATSESIQKDLLDFIAHLRQLDLVVPCSAPSTAPEVQADAGSRLPYAPPSLSVFNDLQELFLIDPVHEVDPQAGWPHRPEDIAQVRVVESGNPVQSNSSGFEADKTASGVSGNAIAIVPDIDLLSASTDGLTIFINRDNGIYCTLEGDTSDLQKLRDGEVCIAADAVADPLNEAGIVQPVTLPKESKGPCVLGNNDSAIVHREIVDQIRPWQKASRPKREVTTSRSRELINALDQFFVDEAQTYGDAICTSYRIGGHGVQVRTLPGQNSNCLLEAIGHLAEQNSNSNSEGRNLTITAWNSSSPSKSVPLAHLILGLLRNWQAICGPRGEVLDLHSDEISAIFNPGPGVLSVVDFPTNRAWIFKCDDKPYPYWEIGSPFRFAMHEWFAAQGLQYVHGGAVGNEKGAVLLVGKGGSGKSTTSMLCAAAGMLYAGDDYCLADCRTDPGQPWIHSLYGTGKLVGAKDFTRLPELRDLSINPDSFEFGGDGKGVYSLARIWPERVVTGMPLRAIIVPEIRGDVATTIAPCERKHALLGLLPSTVGQLPGCCESDCERIVELVESLPAYKLYLGSDTKQIPSVISKVLDS